jgi:hypothetical protein
LSFHAALTTNRSCEQKKQLKQIEESRMSVLYDSISVYAMINAGC